MKKLLVLMLVLGLATSANAALTLVSSAGDTLEPSDYTQIGIYNDTAAAGQGQMAYVVITEGDPGSWTGSSNIYVPPALGGTNTYYGVMTGIGDIWQSNLEIPGVELYGIGVLADYEFHCDALGDVTVSLLANDLATVIDSIVIHQVPEPISIALLGLGGLFLRRRK